MKKILTVSLFAIMAVSAANAEIASTRYVTDRTGDTKTLNKIGTNDAIPSSLTEGVNQLNVYITDQLAEVESGAGELVDGVANDLAAYIGTNDAAVQAAQQQADKGVADAAKAQAAADKAQGEVDALEGVVAQQNTDLTGAIATAKSEAIADAKTETTTQVNALANGAVKTNTESIAAINNAENGILAQAKSYADQKDTAQTTAITSAYQQYADQAEADAIAAAKTETTTQVNALANGAVKTNTESIAAINNETSGILAQAKSYADQKAGEASGSASQVANDLAAYIGTNNTAVAAAQTQADKGVADAAKAQAAADKAQGEVDALEGVVAQQNTDLTGAIATAKSEAISEAKSETTTQVTGLANGAVKTNTDNISTITTNLGGLNGIAIPEACATGRCALVMENNQAKWETINY